MTKLQDFPEFKKAIEKLSTLERELQKKQERNAAIQDEANAASPAVRTALTSRWRTEFCEIEGQEPLLLERIAEAKNQVELIRGSASVQICQEVRPAFIKQIRRVLRSLKELSDANSEMARMRQELEEAGVKTGSIAYGIFTMDRWSDVHGGQVSGYQRWIRENFPELKEATY